MSVRALRFFQLVLLLAAVMAATYPVVNNRFINWDDRDQITQNPDFNPPRLERMIDYWRGPYVGSLYPVSYNLFGLLAWLADDPPAHVDEPLDPRIFHAASILLHALAAVLIWLIVRLLVEQDWPATMAALLFAVHPVQVEAVAWVSGMNTLLVGVLSFAAIWLYLLALQRDRRPIAKTLLFTAAAIAYILALWSKPAAVVVPVMAGLLDWLMTRRQVGRIAIPVLIGLAIAVPVMLITRTLQTVELVTPTPLWSRPIVALDAVAFYLYKLAFPWRLLVDYGRTPQWLIDRPHVWATTGLLTIAVAAICFITRRRWPWAWVSFALFVAALLPVLGLTPFNVQMISTVTDRYLYLAMIGPAVFIGFALAHANARVGNARLAYAALAVLLIAFTIRSNLRARDWYDEFTLFVPELRLNPRSLAAHQVLGTTYSDLAWREDSREHYLQAIGHFQQALEVKPDDPRSLTNLANIFLRTGNFRAAIPLYLASLERLPQNVIAMNNLGVAYENLGDFAEAEKWYRAAIARDPNWQDPQTNLRRLLARLSAREAQPTELDGRGMGAGLTVRSDPQG